MATNTSGHWAAETGLGRVGGISAFAFAALIVLIAVLEQVGVPDRVLAFLFVAATFGGYALIGILTRTLQVGEFYVAARRIPALHNGLAAAAAWASGAMFLGLAAVFFSLGRDGAAIIAGVLLGFVLIAVLIAPYMRKFGAFTVPDFLSARFGGAAARLVGSLVLISASFALLVTQLHLTGLIAARFLGIGFELAAGLGLLTILIGGTLGGMRSLTWTQAAQYLVLIIAFLLPLALFSADLYGWPVPQLTQGLAIAEIGRLAGASGGAAAGARFALGAGALTGPEQLALAVCLAAGIAGLPHLLMRFFTVTSVRQTRRSVGWALLFVALVLITAPTYAVFATLEIERGLVGAPVRDLPDWTMELSRLGLVQVSGLSVASVEVLAPEIGRALNIGVSDGGRLAAGLSAEAGRIWAGLDAGARSALVEAVATTRSFVPDDIWRAALIGIGGARVAAASIQISPQAVVLALPDMAGQPFAIAALAAAGGLAATLSTAMGLLIAVANTISHDVFYRTLAPRASTALRMVLARIAVILVAGAAGWCALTRPADLVEMAAWAFSLAASGLFPAIVMGIWWRRCTSAGAVAGMIAGFAATLGYILVPRYAPDFALAWLAMEPLSGGGLAAVQDLLAVGQAAVPAGPALGWLGMTPLTAGVFGLPVAFATMVLVSLVQRAPGAATAAFVEDIRIPHGTSYMARERAAERRREIGRVGG